ncbi:MAG: AMP-binding protein [Candidatus Omnitrophica bacterium]|nr:AMP-binding protein [Candidatus Omnitrophota bacterium]MCA9447343.1 AMP-binding protein [Candidatus Omnitrophota bacterium]
MKNLQTPFISIPDMISGYAKWQPNQVAWVMGERRVTWREFNERTNRVANALLSLGIEKGDRVSLLMLNSIENAEVIFGIVKAGAVVVPLSPMASPLAVERMIRDSGSKVLFLDACLEGFFEVAGGVPDSLMDAGRISVGHEKEGWSEYENLLAESDPKNPLVEFEPEDLFVIVYSSGTTGTPKGIVHTHRTRVMLGYSLAIPFRVNESSVSIATTPLFTNGTWAMMLPVFMTGGTVILMNKFDTGSFLDLVEKEKATHSLMVPTQFHATIANPTFKQRNLESLQVLVSVGSTLNLELRKAILENFECEFFELYGLTEGVGTGLLRREMLEKPGSVGRPWMGNDIRIVGPDLKEAETGEIGEIVGYASGLMKGYYNRPDLTDEAIWLDERGRTYLMTGDIGRLDEDGYLYVLDRKKDMIVSGGVNIYACDIEEVFVTHPEVKEVSVIAAPHQKWGETPVALVIPEESANVTEQALMEWANARLGKFQRVSQVRFVNDFPRNALGKVLKRELRDEFGG